MKRGTLAALVSLSTLLTASLASGLDSDTRDGVRDMPIVRQQSFRYAPSPWISLPNAPDYNSSEVFITNLKDRTGGLSADAGDATSIDNMACRAASAWKPGTELRGLHGHEAVHARGQES